jgi:c-di-GMP-binding flagellar brake protein YcgR
MDVGQRARIRFTQGRVWGTVLGWRSPQIILVDITEEDEWKNYLKRGTPCEIQYLKEGVIHRFETEILDVLSLSSEIRLLALRFPQTAITKNLRKFPRICVQISAEVIDSDNRTWDCMIHDISRGGCKVEIHGATLSVEDELALFTFLPQGPLEDVKCKIKNYYCEDCYGVEFQDLDPVQRKALDDFHTIWAVLSAPEDVRECDEVLSANLEHISLPELLQILNKSRQDYQIEIANGTELGRLYLKNGEVFSAETSHLVGEEAILELFSLAQARCHVHKARVIPKRNVHTRLDQLILEFAFRLDNEATA